MKATIYDLKRYCQNVTCEKCEIFKNDNDCFYSISSDNLDYCNKVIVEWCASHPVKTRKTEFMKLFPNCHLDEAGYPIFCVQNCDGTVVCTRCKDCIPKFWDKEV